MRTDFVMLNQFKSAWISYLSTEPYGFPYCLSAIGGKRWKMEEGILHKTARVYF